MYQILIVDDEPEVRQLVKLHLNFVSTLILEADCGFDAIKHLKNNALHLVILDLMMENGHGYDVLHYIREHNLDTIVIVLSALSELEEKISTLGLGADDYITKPFSPIELVARVQAHLRRQYKKTSIQSESIRINKLILDKENSILYFEEKKQILTKIECDLLELFIKNADRVFTKQEIYSQIWQHENYDDNNLSVFISRLRKILERTTGHQHLHSVRGIGYRFTGDGT